ncbi:hypothetical protein CTAYLR_006188 [Chrysophaeum taylorii]|uniref:LOV domain-containing protein n=1 Tax=Chrysophaeum taylorii TaxID=2483200 RepID=A0AAD7UNE7_9STRA|nr:hypothetical protein CTAYLR_006188 [Chrysophaeum taylorii]
MNAPVFHPLSSDEGKGSLCGLPMNVLQDYLMEGLVDDLGGDDLLAAPPPEDSSVEETEPAEKALPASVFAAVVKSEGLDVGGSGEAGSMIRKVYHPLDDENVGESMPPLLGSMPPPILEPEEKKRKVDPPEEEQRPKTQAQIDRRRDRNRILARRTRLRKKFFFESLQQQVAELERENAMLKEIMRSHPALAGETSHLHSQPSPVVTDARGRGTELLTPTDFALMRLLQSAQRSFCITDPSLEDNPIVYASQSFLSQTGYALDQVVGRNCRFLQGPLTDRATVERLSRAIARGDDCSATLLNYKADGTTFWNQLFIASLRDINERVVNFVGVQTQVPGPTPPPDACGGIQHPAEAAKVSRFPPSRVLVPASPFASRIGRSNSRDADVDDDDDDDDEPPPQLAATTVPSDHPAASLLASPVFNQLPKTPTG